MNVRWRRLRESSAASSAATLERAGTSTMREDDTKTCPTCDGDGKIRGGNLTCPDCNGSGKVAESFKESESSLETAKSAEDVTNAACSACGGDGVVDGVDCDDCNGTGKMSESQQLTWETLAQLEEAWNADGSLRESAVARLAEKDYSTDKRVEMAKDGRAIPIKNDKGEITGGAYPINDGGDVEDAVASFGHNATDKTKDHIVKNAKKVGATDKLPADWSGSTKTKESTGDLLARLERLEQATGLEAKLRESKPATLSTAFSTPLRVQTSTGQEGYKVVLIREGKGNSEDDNYYTADAIKELCESGVAEGMQAYANHPSLDEEEVRPERDVKQLVGSYQDVAFKESGGKATAEAIFVPLTTDETHPTYGWVITLAEAAARSTAPQPLAGISLYGLSAGDYGKRPDGSEGRMVSMIRPTSGDIVTNAGAGGGFIKQMWESARALRRQATTRKEQPVMQAAEYKQKFAEALKRLREADSDEARTAVQAELDTLAQATIDAPPKPIDTVEALTEAAPKLVEQIREAARRDASSTDEEMREENKTLKSTLASFTDVMQIAETLREAGVSDEVEQRYFVAQARARGLREASDVKDLVETERAYQKAQSDQMLAKLQESMDLPEVEGLFARVPVEVPEDGGRSLLREAGIPTRDAA